MSSCETSDAEGPVPVNSAAVLRKSQPTGSSPCRGHVLRKAKVSSALPCAGAPAPGCAGCRGRDRLGAGSSKGLAVIPTARASFRVLLLFKGQEPQNLAQGTDQLVSLATVALGGPGVGTGPRDLWFSESRLPHCLAGGAGGTG